MKCSVSAVARTTQRLVANMFVAAAVRLGVRAVSAKLTVSDEAGPVGWVVMPDCTGCKTEREKESKSPRQLTRLPTEVTQDKHFKRKGLPVQLCDHCDGDALEEALKAHQQRTSRS